MDTVTLDHDDLLTLPETRDQRLETYEAMGFSPEALDFLRDAGLLRDDSKGEPWRPQTLDDVDWVAWKLKTLQMEAEAIEAQAARRIDRINQTAAAFRARYEDDCLRITRENLPRKPDGSFRRKSIDLDRVRVQIRSTSGGPEVVDEAAVLEYIRSLDAFDDSTDGLIGAVKATRTTVCTGPEALAALQFNPEGLTVKVYADPVKAYVAALPPVVDQETGVILRPATIPGVNIVPPSDKWGFK